MPQPGKTFPKDQKRVLLAMGFYDYRVHRGIEKYAQEHGWHLSADMTKEMVIPWGWNGDGILAWLGAGDELAEFVVSVKIPTVDFSFRRPHLRFPRVLMDHAHGGQLVAEHFLARGFKNFIFYSEADNWAYEERGRGFVKALKHAGHDCLWLRWHLSPVYYPATQGEQWKRKLSWLAAQLQHAPKPVAIFAATDNQALDALEACESVGLAVPSEVAIVGSDNSLLAVDAMNTPISTVDSNSEALGYFGAALLDELMQGKRPPKKPIRIPAASVIVRKSSDLLAIRHTGVANSLRFIWDHFHEPITIKDVVEIAGISRRGLYSAFLEHVGRSPGEELHRVRIERAKRLLATPDHKIEVIARMCGYHSGNSFCVAFKQSTTFSPKQFRNSLAHPPSQNLE